MLFSWNLLVSDSPWEGQGTSPWIPAEKPQVNGRMRPPGGFCSERFQDLFLPINLSQLEKPYCGVFCKTGTFCPVRPISQEMCSAWEFMWLPCRGNYHKGSVSLCGNGRKYCSSRRKRRPSPFPLLAQQTKHTSSNSHRTGWMSSTRKRECLVALCRALLHRWKKKTIGSEKQFWVLKMAWSMQECQKKQKWQKTVNSVCQKNAWAASEQSSFSVRRKKVVMPGVVFSDAPIGWLAPYHSLGHFSSPFWGGEAVQNRREPEEYVAYPGDLLKTPGPKGTSHPSKNHQNANWPKNISHLQANLIQCIQLVPPRHYTAS